MANPETPMRQRSFILKTLWKLQSTVISCVERRVSVAIATQFLPFMAIIEFPLYWSYTTGNESTCKSNCQTDGLRVRVMMIGVMMHLPLLICCFFFMI